MTEPSREQLVAAYKKLKTQATETVRKNKALVARCKADRKLLFMFLAELFGESPQSLASQKNLQLSDLKQRLKERDDLVLKRNDGDQHVEEYKTQIDIQKSQLRALFEEKEKNAQSVEKSKSDLLKCQGLLEKSRGDTATIVGKLKGVVAKCKELQAQKKELEVKLETLSTDSPQVVNENVLKKLQEKCDAQVMENTKLVNKLRQIVAKFKSHQNEYAKCREREESATALVSKMRSEVKQLRERLASSDDEGDDVKIAMQRDYEERIEIMKRESVQTRESMEKLKKMLEKLETEKDVANKELEDSKRMMTEALDSTTAKFKEKLQNMSKLLQEEKQRASVLKEEVEVMRTNASGTDEEKTKLAEELKGLQGKYHENMSKFKAALNKMKEKNNEMDKSKTLIESELKEKIETLENALNEKKQRCSVLEKDLNVMRTNESGTSEEKAKLAEALKELQGKYHENMSKFKAALNKMKEKYDALEKSKVSIRRKVSRMH